jgi:hypothetical protein
LEADVGTAEFLADASAGTMARIVSTEGQKVTIDRPADFLSSQVVPVWVADYGTEGHRIRDIEAPACEDIGAVLLLGPFVGRFEVAKCQPSLITVTTAAKLTPGQKLQYIKKPEPASIPDTTSAP